MQKWEYLFVDYKREEGEWSLEHLSDMKEVKELVGLDPAELSNFLGDQGWELLYYKPAIVRGDLYQMIFKRPKS